MMVKVVKVGNATFPIGNYITPGGMCISLYESYYFYLHYLHPITSFLHIYHIPITYFIILLRKHGLQKAYHFKVR